MKNLFIITLALCILAGCKKGTDTPATSSLTGTWKEDLLLNSTYNKDGVLIKIDTLPVFIPQATYYTDLQDNGQFQSYTLSGNTKGNVVSGTYTYDKQANTFTQNWVLVSPNSNSNIGRVRSNYNYNNPVVNPAYQYNVKLLDEKNITLEIKLPNNVYGAYDGPPVTSTDYTVQTRRLTR